MKDRYQLDELSQEFERHAFEQLKMHSTQVKRYKEEWPDEKLPSHLSEGFCLPIALKIIVDELISLKMQLQDAQIRLLIEETSSYLAPEEVSTQANT